MTLAYSPGWRADVTLGSSQTRTLDLLRVAAKRHPSRSWHYAPRMRDVEPSPGTAHRNVHALARLGLIALQSTLGRLGFVRFTFGVRAWRSQPYGLARRRAVARIAAGQLALALALADDGPSPPPPARDGLVDGIRKRTGARPDRMPSPDEPLDEILRRHGVREDLLVRWRRSPGSKLSERILWRGYGLADDDGPDDGPEPSR